MPQDSPHKAPRGLTAVALFLLFGTAMASLAGITLIFPGTVLDRAWRLNPVAYAQLAPLGAPVGIVFLLLAALLAVAATGWWRRRRWGWVLAVVIIATQLLGDFVNLLRGNVLRGAVGVAIASALLFYMVRPRVRAAF
ncbi:MAG: hypothetical protein LAO18_19805 [Acidobacteriia bacterium]|nr:hypothetical protein [Terriglobia bacterium]